MKLKSLTLTNYGSFVGPVTFKFPQHPGLYFMKGDNRVDERLGGNGAGKSTLWNALYWLTYGKTPDGRKAGDISNWSRGKGTEVEFQYGNPGGDEVWVKRTWGPISWKMWYLEDEFHTTEHDLAKSEANPYLDDVKASPQVFQQSVMMAQGEPMFLDLKSEAQAALFGAVLGLDRWLDYSAKASKLATAKDNECRRLESSLAKLQGQHLETRDYSAEVRAFEEKRHEKLSALGTEFDFANSGAVKDKHNLKLLIEDIKAEDEALAPIKSRRDNCKQSLDDIDLERGKLNKQRAELVREREHLEQLCQRVLDDLPCPTCGMSLADHHAPDQFSRDLEVKVRALIKEAQVCVDKLEDLDKFERDMERTWNKECDLYDKALAHIEDLEAEERRLRNEIDRTNRHMDHLENQLDALEKEPNPFRGMQEEALERARSLDNAISRAQWDLDRANEEYSLYSLWIRGFKEVRLQQIAEALTELEVEVNSSLAELGLYGWELHFDVDRETKSGNVQRGFAVTVLSPANTKPVPWDSWSGGEQQRLRIAGNMGLSNLIRTRMGVSFPLEVWDEPTKGLSPQGVQDLLACLERRARVEGRQIWVIDHTMHNFGGFAGTATIIKDKAGSRIEQS